MSTRRQTSYQGGQDFGADAHKFSCKYHILWKLERCLPQFGILSFATLVILVFHGGVADLQSSSPKNARQLARVTILFAMGNRLSSAYPDTRYRNHATINHRGKRQKGGGQQNKKERKHRGLPFLFRHCANSSRKHSATLVRSFGSRYGKWEVKRLRSVRTKPMPSTPRFSCHSNPHIVCFGWNIFDMQSARKALLSA